MSRKLLQRQLFGLEHDEARTCLIGKQDESIRFAIVQMTGYDDHLWSQCNGRLPRGC
ncbi:uncharacterized protein CMC5_006250 [Chondromyces crocatus]|uniref:Uncharacterized protein n=1 Tax=Chondromyces crocatus TaxID=52 RepID=A0A0K1E6M9_CHOCO|nr:uncharacterized protein CMC5_006250 [Chondromyces crocatus]